MSYKVLLCDDEQSVCDEWRERVQAVVPSCYDILPRIENGEARDAIKELFARETSARMASARPPSPCAFDDADILVLDYDLLAIDAKNARHTGESLARLARTFSDAQVVVVVNQFRDAHFDLSLRGHPASHADLNLDAAMLDVSGLWTDPPWQGFRPWHWQTLCRAVETQRARAAWAEEHLEVPIVEALGMREEDNVAHLSDTAFGFIAPGAKDWRRLRQLTFKDFACAAGNGRGAREVAMSNEDAACRLAGARIGKWLERLVLGPQEALVDLPHLLQRFPFLLGDDVADPAAWNEAVCGADCVKNRLPDDCWFAPSDFLSRPAVWSQRLERDAGFCEQRRSFDFASVPSLVFLEDASAFVPLEEATVFRAGHHNFFDRRFAMCFDGVTYAPQHRLAFAG